MFSAPPPETVPTPFTAFRAGTVLLYHEINGKNAPAAVGDISTEPRKRKFVFRQNYCTIESTSSSVNAERIRKPPEGNDSDEGTSFVRKHPPSAPMPQKDALRIPPDGSDLLEHVPSGTAREKLMKGTNGKP
jgi:hypothetical protein